MIIIYVIGLLVFCILYVHSGCGMQVLIKQCFCIVTVNCNVSVYYCVT